jgi:RHH-type proline utilization regulon transcriptional repressor/proline dehydrogenase/delta 1-pyrroline-5-carboxylate dehydrogenase
MGKSVFGPGIKAGGPNYVAQLMDFEDRDLPASTDRFGSDTAVKPTADPWLSELAERLRGDRSRIEGATGAQVDRALAAIASYQRALRDEFGLTHDHFRLLGQDNIRRYLPVRELRVRLHPKDSFFDLVGRVAAARSLGCRITLSMPRGCLTTGLAWVIEATEHWDPAIERVEEDDSALAEAIREGRTERVRYAAPGRVPLGVHSAAGESGVYLARSPVVAEGRVELLWYVREQSISRDYHRYGNLGERGSEARAAVS